MTIKQIAKDVFAPTGERAKSAKALEITQNITLYYLGNVGTQAYVLFRFTPEATDLYEGYSLPHIRTEQPVKFQTLAGDVALCNIYEPLLGNDYGLVRFVHYKGGAHYKGGVPRTIHVTTNNGYVRTDEFTTPRGLWSLKSDKTCHTVLLACMDHHDWRDMVAAYVGTHDFAVPYGCKPVHAVQRPTTADDIAFLEQFIG
jgi:hypothetical protein